MTIEICLTGIQEIERAAYHQVSRIELCSALEVGGLSPSAGLIRTAKDILKDSNTLVYVFIRPREGDFCYSEREMDLIKKETDFALENGADGIVIGMLKPDGSIDIPKMEQVTQQVGTIPITFHRAMDMCNDLPIALNQLIDLGIENVLTSGGYKSAFDGKEILKQLVNQSQGRINILAGGGVSASNIAILRDYANLTSFHFSCRKKQPGKMLYKNPKVNMSSNSIGLASKETNDDEFAYWVFDEDKFAAIKSALYK